MVSLPLIVKLLLFKDLAIRPREWVLDTLEHDHRRPIQRNCTSGALYVDIEFSNRYLWGSSG
jgi:hypothetical protein